MKPRKSKKKSCGSLPWRLLKRYLANCSIHGVKYLVQDDCHWSERLFWFICCGLSWWGCSQMVSGVLNEYSKRRVATTVETNHLEWSPRLPSLHFCARQVPESKAYVEKLWKKTSATYRFLELFGYVTDIPEPHDSKSFEGHVNSSWADCELIFKRCVWNNNELDCCKIFLPLWTPVGPCLVFNSIHTNVKDEVNFVKSGDDIGVFTVHLKVGSYWNYAKKQSNLYILDRFELPSVLSSREKLVLSKWTTSEIQLNVAQEPTYNEAGVRDVSIEKRNCRFSDETQDVKIFKSYSYDVCVAEETVRRMLEYCGCVSHVYPRVDGMPVCNYTGLYCLSEYTLNLTDSQDMPCVADCEETTFNYFANVIKEKTDPIINVHLLCGPTLRYRRYIVHSKLDLVVAVGSAVGLFVGASILSLVEIPYWFIVRGIDDEDEDESR